MFQHGAACYGDAIYKCIKQLEIHHLVLGKQALRSGNTKTFSRLNLFDEPIGSSYY